MSNNMLTEAELIAKHKNDKVLFHLARTQRLPAQPILQQYIVGFNCGGRPDGMWFARGSAWLSFMNPDGEENEQNCCYLYQINIAPNARILRIRNAGDLAKFESAFPSYWINLDYFNIGFVDYKTGRRVESKKRANLKLPRGKHNLRTELVKRGIIFETEKEARARCAFYKMHPDLVRRFRLTDWSEVAKQYQGISFAWDANDPDLMEPIWYQSLDLPSGCIWDPSAITATLRYQRDGQYWKLI